MSPSKLLCAVVLFALWRGLYCGDAEVTIHVIDEAGAAIPDAKVSAGWNLPRDSGNGSGVGRGEGVTGLSDKDGRVVLSVKGIPGIDVEKSGFYRNGIDGMDVMPKYFAKMQAPDNKITIDITLVKITSPIPMIVRSVSSKLPASNIDCGFDLVLGDWVAPNGKGQASDFIFHVTYKERESKDWDRDIKLSFTKPTDGILRFPIDVSTNRNAIRSPLTAPDSGYVQELVWSEFMHRGKTRLAEMSADPEFLLGTVRLDSFARNQNDNYIFRVRTKMNEEVAPPIEGMWGKIYGPIVLSESGLDVSFRYYVNPTGTRGLEWDTINNLANGQRVPPVP